MSSEFTKIEKQTTGKRRTDPTVTLWRNGKFYFNRPAVDHWLDGVDAVGFYAGDAGELGISRGESGADAFSVSTTADHSGAEIAAIGPLQAIGVDTDALDESFEIDIEERPTEGLLVLDMSAVVDEYGHGYDCDYCPESFDSERGLQIHVGRVHDGGP